MQTSASNSRSISACAIPPEDWSQRSITTTVAQWEYFQSDNQNDALYYPIGHHMDPCQASGAIVINTAPIILRSGRYLDSFDSDCDEIPE